MKQEYKGLIFLGVVIIGYFILSLIDINKTSIALKNSASIIIKMLPLILLIIILMTITNYFIQNKKITKNLQKQKGLKEWSMAIVGGILSSGPVYAWYPMLEELQKKGVKYKYLATFMYTRAIKIPFIPVLIAYFGITYTITLTSLLIIFGILQGIVIDKIMNQKNQAHNQAHDTTNRNSKGARTRK